MHRNWKNKLNRCSVKDIRWGRDCLGIWIDMPLFARKKKTEKLEYDREKQKPVLKCSICNGEQVAGLKDLQTGHFEEVMLIRNGYDLDLFKEMTGVSDVPREY